MTVCSLTDLQIFQNSHLINSTPGDVSVTITPVPSFDADRIDVDNLKRDS